MAKRDLNPEEAKKLADCLGQIVDNRIYAIALAAFSNTELLGDNANTAKLQEKWQAFETKYNQDIYPAFVEAQKSFMADSEAFAKLNAMRMNTDVTSSGAAGAASDQLGAVKQKRAEVEDMIS